MSVTRLPSPYARRRSALERILRMDPLEPLEGIANFSTATTETLTWETATDWDNAVSEAGVVHESNANTDWPGSDVIVLGYPSFDRGGSALIGYWPMHESSSPLHDVTGNWQDCSVSAPTFDDPGIAGGSSILWDGVDDDGSTTGESVSISMNHTISLWYKTSGTDADTIFKHNFSTGNILRLDHNVATGGRPRYWYGKGGQTAVEATVTGNDGVWHHWVIQRSGSGSGDVDNYFDGSDVGNNVTRSATNSGGTFAEQVWCTNEGNRYWDGNLAEVRIYDRTLSASEITALYNDVQNGSLVTATKSFSGPKSPDLQNLSYSLNSESITLDVIGSPGTASEEIVSQSLDGATSYTLTWSNTHQDFRIDIKPSTSTITASPTVSRVELVG